MKPTIPLSRILLIVGFPLILISVMIAISMSTAFLSNTESLSMGITFDLLVIMPLVYFLLIRKTTIPNTTVVPLLIVGIVICSTILPTDNQYYLSQFKTWILPIVELSVVSIVIFKIRKVSRSYQSHRDESFDFFTTLKTMCIELLPKRVANPITTEISVFYYGFIYWRKRELKHNEFSYHKESGTITLMIAIIMLVSIETVALHAILDKWSHIAAWACTFLSVYSGFQLFGFLKSMVKRPITIGEDQLFLRYGIMKESTILRKNIDSIELSSRDIKSDKGILKLSLLGELESHNTIIHLKEENTLIGLYGRKKQYKSIALYVDDKTGFKDQLELERNK